MAGLRRSLCRLVAVELKLDVFDAAHKGLIELYIFSNSEYRSAIGSVKIKHLSCTQSSILFLKWLDVTMA